MSIPERYATFRLAVAGVALALFLVLADQVGPWRGQAAFAVLAILGLEPIVHRLQGGRGRWDERDHALHLRSIQWGMAGFWLVFSVGLWAAYSALQPARQLPIEVLALVGWLTTAAFLVCNAAAVLLVYRLS